MELFLASSSKVRCDLLNCSRIPFSAHAADLNEAVLSAELDDPKKISATLAREKALKISEQYPDALVLGCDQTLIHNDKAFGKPESPETLRTWFQQMGGKAHQLFTSQALVKGGKVVWECTKISSLTLRGTDEIDYANYITENWEHIRHCAGGYMFEVTPHIFSKVEGSLPDIMGLSVSEIGEALKTHAILPGDWEAPKFAAVLGHPIAHSKSPNIHRYWLEKYGIAGDYLKIDIPPAFFHETIKVLLQAGLTGFNVTIPHKNAALSSADVVTKRAKRIGAANTLYLDSSEGLVADNTDGLGFLAHLKQSVQSWESSEKKVAVIGAGGAARAVVSALIDDGASKLVIVNRTEEKAAQIASEYDDRVVSGSWDSRSVAIGNADLIVNTTALGMEKMPALVIDFSEVLPGKVFYDLVYAPLETDFLKQANEKDCFCVDGLGMLLHQAAPGFASWYGVMPLVDRGLRDVVLGK